MPTTLGQTPHSQGTDKVPKTDWPDAPTTLIPWISSTTTDLPPEVKYHKRTTIYTAKEEDIPELEEDEDQQEYNNNHHLITHLNTHQESERMKREYTERLQDLDDQQYYDQIDRAPELQYFLPQAPYDPPELKTIPTTHQPTTQRTTDELHQLFGRGQGKTGKVR